MRTTLLRRLEITFLTILILMVGSGLAIAWNLYGGREVAIQALQFLGVPSPYTELRGRHVGLVAGHSGNDSGAVCTDGLREVDVNEVVAQRTAAVLRLAGAQVEVLAEYDARLNSYRADVLLSIHTDSCINATGFKVARAVYSVIPDIEDRLVACLYQTYGQASGLPRHDGSITVDMTQYHAFRVIDPQTPAAIIELGFLGTDRPLLTTQQDQLAAGLAEGIGCFLQSVER